MELFKLLGSIVLNNTDANKNIDETTNKAEKSHGKIANAFSKIGKAGIEVGKVVAKGLASGTEAAIKLGKVAIDAYSDYQQLVGGVETLFGKSADKVKKYADNAYKTAGMSANTYMETVTGFSASLLKSLNNDTEAAAEKADKAITDMSDNANKMGTDMSLIQNAYQGFAKQNYTMLDNLKLGYGGTQEEMQRLLEDASKLSGVKYDISSYADIVDAIHVVQTEMGITGTTAKEASTTIQGSVSSMKGAWENLMVGLADENQDFDALLDNFIDSVITVIENILPRISIVAQKIPYLISSLVSQLPGIITNILPSLVNAATSLIQGLIDALPDIISALVSVLPLLLDGLSTIVDSLVAALPPIVNEITRFLMDPNNIQMILEAAITLMAAIPMAISKALPGLMAAAPDIIFGIIEGLISALPLLLSSLDEIFTNMLNAFLSFFGIHSPSTLMTEKAGYIVEGIINGIKALPEQAAVFFTKMKDKIVEIINNLKSSAVNKFYEIKEKITTHISNAKEKVVAIFSSLKTGIASKIEAIKTSVSDKFNAIKSKITTPIQNASDKIKQIIDKIKSIFSGLKLSFPNIKMPHFSITPSGWKIGDLLEGSIPKLSIDWYAKAMDDGLIMNEPTVFGVNSNGQVMAGGETGSETVVGTQSLMNMIKTAVADENAELVSILKQILALLISMKGQVASDIINALESVGIKYDDREIARLVRKYA